MEIIASSWFFLGLSRLAQDMALSWLIGRTVIVTVCLLALAAGLLRHRPGQDLQNSNSAITLSETRANVKKSTTHDACLGHQIDRHPHFKSRQMSRGKRNGWLRTPSALQPIRAPNGGPSPHTRDKGCGPAGHGHGAAVRRQSPGLPLVEHYAIFRSVRDGDLRKLRQMAGSSTALDILSSMNVSEGASLISHNSSGRRGGRKLRRWDDGATT
ncbi:hypothetical protein N656DRAFT_175349 [Canariomyces notabilis]|uniref:Uncharacterized protein n=1 Tax=Canariomyces notabilis TaxID=2074819 RepID=A0AAN6TBA0_9PEZI|nr:hypothetical protein N656DRAFT_175349 [Canariomyces arenarius]